jgi:hypothetical protein
MTLILVACLDKARFTAHFGWGQCQIESPNNQIIAEILLQQAICTAALGACNPNSDIALSATQKLTPAQAHKVLGHIHYRVTLDSIRLGNIQGIELSDTEVCTSEATSQALSATG